MELLGIAGEAQERAKRFAARNPALARRILGQAPVYQPADCDHHRITIDLKAGTIRTEKLSVVEIVAQERRRKAEERRVKNQRDLRLRRKAEEERVRCKAELIQQRKRKASSTHRVEDIMLAVCDGAGITIDQFQSKARPRLLADARKLFWYLVAMLREDISYPTMALLAGCEDHTSACYGAKKFHDVREQEPLATICKTSRIAELLEEADGLTYARTRTGYNAIVETLTHVDPKTFVESNYYPSGVGYPAPVAEQDDQRLAEAA